MFECLCSTGVMAVPALQFKICDAFVNYSTRAFSPLPAKTANFAVMTLVAKQRANTRKENPKTINIRKRKKFNGTATKPRLSVFCSTKQLYAMLVDDENKKCLYYGSTLQKSLNESSSCTTIEVAQRLGEELVKACEDLHINEISSYDRNSFSRGERMQAFEIAISRHGFLLR
ncbi:50S ribosomal protein L18 [Euphorbia peplus]|nr:50S ribosomal protein L18 [Euphorbia peplus]